MLEDERKGRMKPGQDLVAVGRIGRPGTRALAEGRKEELSRWFSQNYQKQIAESREPEVSRHLDYFRELGAAAYEPAGRGGILKAIWDLTGACRAGAVFWLRRIPVGQDTIEVCERCGANPYRLWCGSCMVLAAQNGGRIVEACHELGIPAAVIGQVTEGIAREMRHGDETGYLERPREDELVRILGAEQAAALLSKEGIPAEELLLTETSPADGDPGMEEEE